MRKLIKRASNFVKKTWQKAVVCGLGLVAGSTAIVQSAHATAPASLADALAVSIDTAIVWTAMSVMIGIVASIAAYYIIKRIMGSR